MLHFEIVFIRSPSNLIGSCLHIVLSYRGAPTQHEARVGQSPILVEYGQPLFIWLPRDWPSVRTYVRVYIMYRWGRGDYQKQGRAVSGVSWQIHIFYIRHSQYVNRPFPSSKKCHFQSEAKCEAIVMKMSFNYDANTTHFHNKGFRT